MSAAKAKTKQPLSKGAKIAIIVGGDVLLLLMGWFLLISPQRSTAKSISQSIAATQLQIAEAKKPIVQTQPTAVEQPEIETADLYSLAKAMPSTMDTPTLLLELNQIARQAGVTLSTIQPGQPDAAASATSFSTIPINLTFNGNFYSLTDVLYRLRSLVTVRDGALQTAGRLFSVNEVGLAAAGGGTGADTGLTATVTVNAYVYGGTPAAAPVTTTPGVTETSSTTTTTSTTEPPPAANAVAGN
jgi:Tfp pilus assembly protein PilO